MHTSCACMPSLEIGLLCLAVLQLRPGTVINCGVMLFNVKAVGAGVSRQRA